MDSRWMHIIEVLGPDWQLSPEMKAKQAGKGNSKTVGEEMPEGFGEWEAQSLN